jgi:CHASE3 domain sensor protein
MMDKLPEATAKECDQRFPIKETIDTIQVPDDELIAAYEREYAGMYAMIDSLINAKCDTVYKDKIIEIIKKIPGKPQIKHIVKTKENTAKQQVIIDSCQKMSSQLNQKLDKQIQISNELTAKLHNVKGQRNWLFWLVMALLFWTFRRFIGLLLKRLYV